MSALDFDTVTSIAADRADIGIFMSSTPTGKRSKFYEACTNPDLGYREHYHPSMHNPNWGEKMEAEFKAQLSEEGYIHEILAEFGTQQTGVFPKDKVDEAIKIEQYAYNALDYNQQKIVIEQKTNVRYINFDENNPPYRNVFRCMGVDWDRYINC